MRSLLLALAPLGALLSAPAPPQDVPAHAPALRAEAAAPRDEVEDLIAEGRKLLARYEATQAEALFRQAAELDGHTLRTEMWVLRARMDQGGHSNDVLDAIQELARASDGPVIDYLFGMAYARRAEEQIRLGTQNAVDMNLQDAIVFLTRATQAEPDRFEDAYLPLARAAWYRTDLPVARAAIDEAIAREPSNPEAAFELGRIAFSQYSALKDSAAEGDAALADRRWEEARDAFRRAIELCGEPGKRDARAASLLARSHVQLGHALMWKQVAEEARAAYAAALEWDPSAVDVATLFNLLGTEGLAEVLEQAAPRFEKRYGKIDSRDSAMLWWLGYVRYASNKPKEAEEAFLESLKKAPGYANAWFYVAMARYDQKDYPGAAEALVEGFRIDPVAIVREMSTNVELNTAKVEYVIGPLVQASRYAEAAVLAEICAESAQDEPRHFNNQGFFLREEAIRLSQLRDEDERKRAPEVFEASLEAYERALELAPDDPTYLNDTAVVLHYYLDRDLDRALALYEEAERLAQAKLDAGNMLPEVRTLVQTALRDARNNKRLLEELLAKRAAEARRSAPPEGGDAGGGGGAGGGDGQGDAGGGQGG